MPYFSVYTYPYFNIYTYTQVRSKFRCKLLQEKTNTQTEKTPSISPKKISNREKQRSEMKWNSCQCSIKNCNFFYINLIRFLLCVTNIKRSQTIEWINWTKRQAKINSFMYDRDWYCFRNLPIIKACYLSCNRVNKGGNLQGGHMPSILIIVASILKWKCDGRKFVYMWILSVHFIILNEI